MSLFQFSPICCPQTEDYFLHSTSSTSRVVILFSSVHGLVAPQLIEAKIKIGFFEAAIKQICILISTTSTGDSFSHYTKTQHCS